MVEKLKIALVAIRVVLVAILNIILLMAIGLVIICLVFLILLLGMLFLFSVVWGIYLEATFAPHDTDLELEKTRISREFDIEIQVNMLRAAVVAKDTSAIRFLSEQVGKTYDLDPALLYRLWWLESRFQHDARSSQGAIGLGQVRLDTARWHYNSGLEEEDLYDPILNAFISGKILRDYLNWTGGDMREALLYYHAGPNKIRRIRSQGEEPFNLWYSEKLLATS